MLQIGLSHVIQAVMQTDGVTTSPDCPTDSIHQAHLLKHEHFGMSVSLYCHYCINLPQEVTRKYLDRILLFISDDRLCGCIQHAAFDADTKLADHGQLLRSI